jgi:hypothetical protein
VAAGVALGVLPYYLMTTRPWEDNGSEGLAGRVEQSMQHNLDSNQGLAQYHLSVQQVTVVPEVGNEYEGLATIRTAKGTQRDVAVHVVADKDGGMIWQVDPGAFLFAVQEEPLKTGTGGS